MPIKTTVITGATSGIGLQTALALAKKDHAVFMLVRDTDRGEQARQHIISETGNQAIHVVYCDLADMPTVKAAAEYLKSKLFAINVQINNAGGIFAERRVSTDGYEMTLAVNHLGHFLLTMCLMPLLERGQARVINVSSEAHRIGKPNFTDMQSAEKYTAFKVYGTAKLYNIYFAKSLAERYQHKGITAFALHPGIVKSNFWFGVSGVAKLLKLLARPFMISAEDGAKTSVYLATAPKIDAMSGSYFKKQRVIRPSRQANNKVLRDHLWDISTNFIERFVT